MGLSIGSRQTGDRRSFELDAPAPERLDLDTSPKVDIVASYVLTRAAERSWQDLNRHLAGSSGAVFWIGGPAGCGKTHFLNYVIGLQRQGGALEAENARRLICGLEVAGRVRAAEIEFYLLSALAEQLGSDPRTGALWREMTGAAALTMALESARRTGIRALTVAIDFGLSDCGAAADFFSVVADVAAKFNHVRFTVIAAGRAPAPGSAYPLEVAPHDADEEMVVAVRRARRLSPGAEAVVHDAYHDIDTGGFAPEAIFPFHPTALRALRTLASPPVTIAALARLAREALVAPDPPNGSRGRLVYPAATVMNDVISKRLEMRLADPARAALKIAHQALGHFSGNLKELAREIIDTLVVENLAGDTAPISISDLAARLPTLARDGSPNTPSSTRIVSELLRQLDLNTRGIIRFDSGRARFDSGAAGAPQVAVYNRALTLARHFDSSLAPARDLADLTGKLNRLGAAMSLSVESAHRIHLVLAAALADANLPMPEQHEIVIAEYVALAESGYQGIIETSEDSVRQKAAMNTISAYEALETVASMVPRMRAMREYLAATGLQISSVQPCGDADPSIAALETECELLAVALGSRALTGTPRNLDALEARFHRFKWTYVQHYLEAHRRWRFEMESLALIAEDARRHSEALTRLNAIIALGPPAKEELAARVSEVCARVVACALTGPLAPETTARCIDCDFQLGASSPRADLSDLMDSLRGALASRLTALSQSMIARLIREHDHEHRLEGFLKIIQAAQTDSIVRVLDANLARYLGSVLDDNLHSQEISDSLSSGTVESMTASSPPLTARKRGSQRRIMATRRDGQ